MDTYMDTYHLAKTNFLDLNFNLMLHKAFPAPSQFSSVTKSLSFTSSDFLAFFFPLKGKSLKEYVTIN